jgi:ribulose-5-phosphate 4-epimerase/fuculose-1-phosphate aldolase
VSYQPADAAGAVVLSVLACQALAAAGQGDMIWGHASVRDPQGRGVWMKSAGWGLEEIDASKIILVSPDGEVVDDPASSNTGPRHIEYPIHTEIMASRPGVGSVVHTHSPAANQFAALDVPLRPLDHAGSLFCYPDIPPARPSWPRCPRARCGAGAPKRTPSPSAPTSGRTASSGPAGST